MTHEGFREPASAGFAVFEVRHLQFALEVPFDAAEAITNKEK